MRDHVPVEAADAMKDAVDEVSLEQQIVTVDEKEKLAGKAGTGRTSTI